MSQANINHKPTPIFSGDQPPERVAPARSTQAPEIPTWTLPGFCGTAQIMTALGYVPISDLKLGVPVKTRNLGYRRVEWIDNIELNANFLGQNPTAYPLLIPASSLGPSQPRRDMLISQAQRIDVPRYSGCVSAQSSSSISGRTGISRVPKPSFKYYLFHCGTPVSVDVEGLWCEVTP